MNRRLVIVGGGVIGLSIAWEGVRRGWSVTLLERRAVGREASWASAGILTYANPKTARDPLDRLAAASHPLHARWYPDLVAASGVDYQLRTAGTVHLARTRAERAALIGWEDHCRQEEIPCDRLPPSKLRHELPQLDANLDVMADWLALKMPNDGQLRSPRFLSALRGAAEAAGVRFIEDAGDTRLLPGGDSIARTETGTGEAISAEAFCIASGAWSGSLLSPLGVALDFVPIRGQIAYFKLPVMRFAATVYEGGNYLVPRLDGGLLAGSTMEDVGFEKGTTPDAIGRLTDFAASLVPELRGRMPDQSWSGLRPATFDGLPYVGAVPGFNNLWLAAGHYRAGIHLAPITATGICDMIEGRVSDIDWTPFRPARG